MRAQARKSRRCERPWIHLHNASHGSRAPGVRGFTERRLPKRSTCRREITVLHLVDMHLPGCANAFQNGLTGAIKPCSPVCAAGGRLEHRNRLQAPSHTAPVANALRAGQRLPRAGTRLVVPPLEHAKARQVGQENAGRPDVTVLAQDRERFFEPSTRPSKRLRNARPARGVTLLGMSSVLLAQ